MPAVLRSNLKGTSEIDGALFQLVKSIDFTRDELGEEESNLECWAVPLLTAALPMSTQKEYLLIILSSRNTCTYLGTVPLRTNERENLNKWKKNHTNPLYSIDALIENQTSAWNKKKLARWLPPPGRIWLGVRAPPREEPRYAWPGVDFSPSSLYMLQPRFHDRNFPPTDGELRKQEKPRK